MKEQLERLELNEQKMLQMINEILQPIEDNLKNNPSPSNEETFEIMKLLKGKIGILTEEMKKHKIKNNNEGKSLIFLIKYNFSEIAKFLIKKNINIHQKSKKHRTPLHMAAKNGLVEIIQILIEKGAKLEEEDKEKKTPLHLAIYKGHLEAAKILIENRANLYKNGKLNYDLLFYAGHNEQLAEYLRDLYNKISSTQQLNSNTNNNSKILLNDIQNLDNINESVRNLELTAQNINVNKRNKHGKTPLHTAAENGLPEIIRILINKGADLEAEDNKKKTPLQLAINEGKLRAVKILIENGANLYKNGEFNTQLILDAQRNPPIAEYLQDLYNKISLNNMQNHDNINIQDKNGSTALHKAAKKGDIKKINILLQAGADVNIQDKRGRTALHKAAYFGSTEIVKTLLEKNQNLINIKDKKNHTILHYATSGQNIEIVKILLQIKPDLINMTNNQGDNVLHSASSQGNIEIIEFLLKTNPDLINKKNNKGETILHLASFQGNIEIVKILLEKNSDLINIKDNEGRTALHLASYFRCTEIVKILLEKNPDLINIKDNDGQTALDYARLKRRQNIVEILENAENFINETLIPQISPTSYNKKNNNNNERS